MLQHPLSDSDSPRRRRRALAVFVFALIFSASIIQASRHGGRPRPFDTRAAVQAAPPTIMFVTQPPFAGDFTTVNSTFGNHKAVTGSTPRGGDLYIRYPDGSLRNLTAQAGYGLAAGQDIAVREPSVHWSGTKALFSMVVGGTIKNDYTPVYWQIYEVTGIGQGEQVQIRKLAQPTDYNNVSPLYGTDDRILFTSDRPRNGDRNLYPQLDEYESAATVTGIWSMNPDGTDLKLLDHTVSGAFTPIIASDGRVIFTRWDHLQRDQQNNEGTGEGGAFNYVSESSSQQTNSNQEIYPEPRTQPSGSHQFGHTFNIFMPWQMNEDGTGLETVNHVGRQELSGYVPAAHQGLPEIGRGDAPNGDRFFHIKESPTRPGYFYGVFAPEFGTHTGGQIVALRGGESVNPDDMAIEYVTDRLSAFPLGDGIVNANHPGLFRNPVPLSDGSLMAVHSSSPYADSGSTRGQLTSRYDFKLTWLQLNGTVWKPAGRIIPSGILKSITYWDNYTYTQISYNGALWELDPVEVRARPRPAQHVQDLPEIEKQILREELGGQAGLDQFQNFLRTRNLALVVSRNVTRRADKQQDFNLKITGSSTQTAVPGSTPVEIEYMQFFQGDLIRGYTNYPRPGRRPLAQIMHDGLNPPLPTNGPAGSVKLGADGSMAALVPATRALSWQMTKTDGTPVVRERYWVTFAAGEMRSCTNCHGINRGDVVLGQPSPTNPPQALRDLARWYRDTFVNGGNTPPTVALTSPTANATFNAPATITVTASATDAQGPIAVVEFFQGGTKLGEAFGNPYSMTWTNVPAGAYTLTAKATDNQGLSAVSAPVNITVTTPANQPPTVSITTPSEGAQFTAPANVTIGAQASDADGSIALVEFFNEGGLKIGEDATAPYGVTWTNVPAGTYRIIAKATDNRGASTVSSGVGVVVKSPTNAPPEVRLTSPANGATFTAPATVSMTASASDRDGQIVKVEFFQGDVKLGEDVTSPHAFTWSNVAAGTYRLTAKATDNAGASTVSAAVTVTVNAPTNKPPTVSIIQPTADQVFKVPADITIAVQAADSDGKVVKVEYFDGDVKIGESVSSPFTFVWKNAPVGRHTLKAKATDDRGATVLSKPVRIRVVRR